MTKNTEKEVRAQYMLPHQLNRELKRLPLIYLPAAPLEWHGPHMALGVDALDAEQVALGLARKLGGVVLPTLYMGTERERTPDMLKSLGFKKTDYVVGMDFPKAKGLYKSFYLPEEVFALALRAFIEQCIAHGYRYIFIVNGHGAVNQIATVERLATEFSHKVKGVMMAQGMAFPEKASREGSAGHACAGEASLLMHYDKRLVDLSRLPPRPRRLRYSDYSIVDGGGFDGSPGPGHTVPDREDPRLYTTPRLGKEFFDETIRELSRKVRDAFGLR